MTQPITRIYETETRALDAVAELKKHGVTSDHITVVGPSSGTAPDSGGATSLDDGIVAAICTGGVPKAAATIYAKSVRRGCAVVSITPLFGTARSATRILESFKPIDIRVNESTAKETVPSASAEGNITANDQATKWDEFAPMSSSVHMPALLDDPSPLSTFFRLPMLADDSETFSARFGIPLLSNGATPLSAWLKLPVLSSDATPFSTFLKLPVLSSGARLSPWLGGPIKPKAPARLPKALESPSEISDK